MKVVILAGGLGTRLAEETRVKPKPMVEIGGRPILWHIMNIYSCRGFSDFYIALGYKGDMIKRFFVDYYNLNGSMTIDLNEGTIDSHDMPREQWRVNLIETGMNTQTGGRLKRLESSLRDATFMLTYGDGVCNVNVQDLLHFHRSHGRIGTVTAVHPPARFGGLTLNGDNIVTDFAEKPQIGEGWINGGFFVFEPQIFDYLDGDQTNLEADALPVLAADQQLVAYRHEGFWQPMDTLREKQLLENLWQNGQRPWKVWED